ncbi:MAG: sugar MFS transporter [Flavobacteriaceae bacterium]
MCSQIHFLLKNTTTKNYSSQIIPIAIIAGLFFIFGFVTWINGALIPFMKTIHELTDAQSYLVASASYISFVVMALPSAYVLKRTGYRKGMSLGLLIMAMGALVFIPAAQARTYWMFLVAIFIQGTGMTLLQTASNPYITILGPIDRAAKRIAIMGIANKVAGGLGSVIFGALLLTGIEGVQKQLAVVSNTEKAELLNAMANSVIVPYLIMTAVLVLLGLLIRKAPLPHVEAPETPQNSSAGHIKASIFNFPHLWLGVLTLFAYVGAEVIAGDTIISYGISLGFPVADAKYFTMYTLLAMVFTYALGIVLIPKYISQDNALKISAALGIVFSLCIINTNGATSVFFVAALGIANALVWPAVWPLTLKGLGSLTKTASALLIMAISGGAIIPPLYGRLVDKNKYDLIASGVSEADALSTASTSSYWILLPCYVLILYYALNGHKLRSKKME